jgi:hypothetical protein
MKFQRELFAILDIGLNVNACLDNDKMLTALQYVENNFGEFKVAFGYRDRGKGKQSDLQRMKGYLGVVLKDCSFGKVDSKLTRRRVDGKITPSYTFFITIREPGGFIREKCGVVAPTKRFLVSVK